MSFSGRDETSIAFYTNRNFDAPRDRVWQAFTAPEELARWFLPEGAEVIQATGTLRVGAMFLYGYRGFDGADVWGRLLYREIHAPMQLVYVESYTNPRGGPVRHPGKENWPIEVLTTINLGKAGGGTALTYRALPQNATEPEKAAFLDARFDMRVAAAGLFERLEHHLTRK